MWTPKYIILKNLWAHVETRYEFKQGVCTVIFGENRDDDDSDNNGAGKSTLFEAISIALTGKSLRDIDKEVFINRQSEDCLVEFYLENSVSAKSLKVIRRFYRGSKSSRVEVFEDGAKNTQLVSVNEANARIIELLGITREDLVRYFIISQDSKYQFFTAGDGEKKEVLNRITNADMINPIIDKLSDEKKRINACLGGLNDEANKYEGKLELYREQRAEAAREDVNDDIVECGEKIKKWKDKIADANDSIDDYKINIEKIKKSSDYQMKDELPDVDVLSKKRKKIRSSIKELEAQEDEATEIIKRLKADLSGAIQCPECNALFIPESNYGLSVEETKKLLAETQKKASEITEDIKDKQGRLQKINKQIENAEETIERVNRIVNKLDTLRERIEVEKDNVDRYKSRIAQLNDEIDALKKNDKKDKLLKDLDEKIRINFAKLCEIKESIAKNNEELLMVDYWLYYMGKNGFATFLANKAVAIIEGVVNSFLEKFHSSMRIEINGFKVNKDGSVRDKIDILAVYKGKYAQNFMGYSGGERSRMYLASILGIQHLINLSNPNGGLDLLLLDESLGALDSRGVVNICNILNTLGVTTLMITQNVSNDVNIDNKVLVVRENEVSRIVKC